jgi:hypothetical protein
MRKSTQRVPLAVSGGSLHPDNSNVPTYEELLPLMEWMYRVAPWQAEMARFGAMNKLGLSFS